MAMRAAKRNMRAGLTGNHKHKISCADAIGRRDNRNKNNDGRCCVSRACACRKSEGGPRVCSSSCACQKLIKRQQEQQRQQGDGDQNLVECANPATTASVIQAAAAELFAAAHNPPQPASGNEEDNPGSSSEKAVDLCNTSDSDSEQDVGDQGEADACDSDSSTDREA